MPALANPKHEMFARCLVQGLSQSKAYLKAGYSGTSSSTANASTLAKRPEIRARVQELIEERERATGEMTIPDATMMPDNGGMPMPTDPSQITPEWILMELVENARSARVAGQFAASTKALEMIGKSLGMFSEEEVAKRKRGEAERESDKIRAGKAVPIDKLNKLLTEAGFQGTLDLTKLDTQPEAALPIEALTASQ